MTLSAGFLAASASALGLEALRTREVWWAVAGLASMGLLNVGVSFGLALWLAVRARGVTAPGRRALRRAILRRLLTRPSSFFYPVAPTRETELRA